MKLSAKGRYGIRAMYDLALRYGEGPQSLKSIAQRQNVPDQYLEQLFLQLKRAELIETVRGAQGGYMLRRDPSNIAMGDIVRALEGDIAPECAVDDRKCENAGDCVMHVLYSRMYDGLSEVLDGFTLRDMVEDTASLHAGCNA